MASEPAFTPSTLDAGGRHIALLPEGFIYRIFLQDDVNAEEPVWEPKLIDANAALAHVDGTVAFYKVVGNVWFPVITFPAGWYGPYSPTVRPDHGEVELDSPIDEGTYVPAEDTSQELLSVTEPHDAVEPDWGQEPPRLGSLRERLLNHPAPEPEPVADEPAVRPEDLFEDHEEYYHKRLKDIWEGKGDPSKEHLTHLDENGEWATTPEEAERQMDELRKQSDAEFQAYTVTDPRIQEEHARLRAEYEAERGLGGS
ncbi:hypothetical protein SEA_SCOOBYDOOBYDOO_223 [Mycobacterium phage ScoobyDoobyDoo]|nr:hypothetical protein SEA_SCOOBYDOOBYDOO_223 [Mycobacterium phage ScoobyDoobyDoo]